ncbi:MAG: M23 family metallopeptidase, partial [Thermoanaerobaculia bacterium]
VAREAAAAAPAALSVEASPSSPKQGGLVFLLVRSGRPLESLAVAGKTTGVFLEGEPGGRSFRGLAGVDLEAKAGKWEIRFEAVEAGGRSFSPTHRLRVEPGRFEVEPLRVDPRFVEPPPGEADRIREERERVAQVWETGEARRLWAGPFRDPVEAPAGSNFGARRVFNGQPRSRHTGVDFAAPAGAPVTAPAPGRVALAEVHYFSGGTVILDHGGGLFTTYFHLSRLDVREDEPVETGDRIGAVGATGRATGPHLHWGARLRGARIDPLTLRWLPSWPLEPGR